ncbi:hypothetical protein GCM10027589_00250 [Actinocorallia lasiicapitis]
MRDVTITAHQGLILGGPAEVGFDKTSLDYIPGSVLRGALAAAWIKEHGVPARTNPHRKEFIDLFEGEIRYGRLLQDGTSVTPLTAQRCKYPRTSDCLAWSADAAVDEEAVRCPNCGGGIDAGKGEIVGVQVRRVLRAALEDDGRAKDGHLYARRELSSARTYRGTITGSHPYLDQERHLWLGGRTTTSGHVTLRTTPAAPRAVPDSPRPDGALIVQLTGPAIVVDDVGRPSLDPVPEILRLLGLPGSALKTSRTWTRPQRVGGWHAASGLPKPTELALNMGSVTVLHLSEGGDTERLAREGIGLRRSEGFGTVQLNPAPWRLPARSSETQQPEPTALDAVRDLGLLDREREVRWLLDRGRQALVARERGRPAVIADFFQERVAIHFDDPQAEAVRELFNSEQLPAALALLELRLEQVANP